VRGLLTREITVIAAAVIGAAVGIYRAMLWRIAGAVAPPWLTNR
jgi:hypothetical protein